jgi:hypothetical protein
MQLERDIRGFRCNTQSMADLDRKGIYLNDIGLSTKCQWLTSTREAEIRRTVVQNQPGQIVCKTLS